MPEADRNALLASIQKGKKLKKAVTNDRSAPAVGNVKSTGPATGGRVSSGGNAAGNHAPTMPSGGPMGMGGLFAGGMPKLRSTGSKILNEESSSKRRSEPVLNVPRPSQATPPSPNKPSGAPLPSRSHSTANVSPIKSTAIRPPVVAQPTETNHNIVPRRLPPPLQTSSTPRANLMAPASRPWPAEETNQTPPPRIALTNTSKPPPLAIKPLQLATRPPPLVNRPHIPAHQSTLPSRPAPITPKMHSMSTNDDIDRSAPVLPKLRHLSVQSSALTKAGASSCTKTWNFPLDSTIPRPGKHSGRIAVYPSGRQLGSHINEPCDETLPPPTISRQSMPHLAMPTKIDARSVISDKIRSLDSELTKAMELQEFEECIQLKSRITPRNGSNPAGMRRLVIPYTICQGSKRLNSSQAYGHIKHNVDTNSTGPIRLQDIPPDCIRNFGIIAHIDHGKSTLADRLLELTGCASRNHTSNPILDALPVERERGITVKAQAASMFHKGPDGDVFMLNLMDTPGHADFTHEVTRSLAAVQGALLLVDACAGVQAQTVAHYWRAMDYGVKSILPVLNKVDLPAANVDRCLEQIEEQLKIDVLGDTPVLTVSAKTGYNVGTLLPSIIKRIPPPSSSKACRGNAKLELLLIDSWYKEYRGVICLVSVRYGQVRPGDSIQSAASRKAHVVDEVGILQPNLVQTDYLGPGQVGYIRCRMESASDALIGDTFFDSALSQIPSNVSIPPKARPIVQAGMFPTIREHHEQVSQAVDKLLLNDSSVTVERIVSVALGPGWRLGFLGSLHLDVFRQRLEQEFHVDVIMTTPNVSYEAIQRDGSIRAINACEDFPNGGNLNKVKEFREPFVKATIIAPSASFGLVSKLCSEARCGLTTVEYLSTERVRLSVELPLVEIIGDFNDRLLSRSAGYASFDYEPCESKPVDLVKIGVRLNGDLVDILGTVQPKVRAEAVGRSWAKKLAKLLPNQQFPVAIQAVIGTKVIARETIAAMRKDVIAKCYGGDKTRKMKLLEAQKEGKARLRMLGKVEIPHDAFVSIMRLSRD